jgi:hypothetical protein
MKYLLEETKLNDNEKKLGLFDRSIGSKLLKNPKTNSIRNLKLNLNMWSLDAMFLMIRLRMIQMMMFLLLVVLMVM